MTKQSVELSECSLTCRPDGRALRHELLYGGPLLTRQQTRAIQHRRLLVLGRCRLFIRLRYGTIG